MNNTTVFGRYIERYAAFNTDTIEESHRDALKENFRRTLARNKARIEAETDAKHTLATWEHDGVTFYLTES